VSRPRRIGSALAVVGAAAVVLAGCSSAVQGRAVSVFDDPFKVGGLEAVDGPTGLRPDPKPGIREVIGTDGGEIDLLAAESVSDLEEFWRFAYPDTFDGELQPIENLLSWDSDDYGGRFCDESTAGLVNAGYCEPEDSIGWDRAVLMPALRQAHGDMAITMVLAHEYGHAIQRMATLNPRGVPTLVSEQQADCLAGVYLRWVAEGKSPRFTLSTGEGLNNLLAAMISFRDPVLGEDDLYTSGDEHGSAFERISAFQFGFTDGAAACKAITIREINERRGELPVELPADQTGELPITETSVRAVVDALNIIFAPSRPPQLSFDAESASRCPDARPSPPVSYCPAANTITVDLPALQQMGTPIEGEDGLVLQGDNTAYSALTSRYMLALQNERGLVLDSAEAGLRTACLTGVATTAMSAPIATADGDTVALTAGDLDEAVAGLLTNGLAAGDVNGESVPAGFSRIDAFRVGVLGDAERCLTRFP